MRNHLHEFFDRNGINLGLPLVVCPGISKLDLNHKEISLDLEAGTLTADGKVVAQVEPFTPYVLSILEAGGIKNMIRAKAERLIYRRYGYVGR